MNFGLENIPLKTRDLLEKLSRRRFMHKFYLAGGTAAALYLGHRQSNDLDFFSEEEFNASILVKNLKQIGKFQGLKSAENTIIGDLNGIKISFFALPYKLLEMPARHNNLRIAQLIDIATMKILAISDRRTKRDFIDLYFLCQQVKPLEEFIYLFQKKFGKYNYNIYHIIKSLVYFDDAEKDKIPKMYRDVSWLKVKEFFLAEQYKLAKKFLRI